MGRMTGVSDRQGKKVKVRDTGGRETAEVARRHLFS